MKKTSKFIALALIAATIIFGHLSSAQNVGLLSSGNDHEQRMEWWRDARFGLFIHWGLYSIPAGVWKGETARKDYAEWAMHNFQIPLDEYSQLAKQFNPIRFDADEWAELARDAGMGYFVLTTKHHDGFAMFDSDVSEYNIVDATPYKRDVFGELVDAFTKRNLRVGAYYSQDLDWSQPQGGIIESYNTWDFPSDRTEPDYGIFDEYLHGKALPQIEELATKYGKISVFWFDFPRMVRSERGKLVHDLVRKHQPEAVISGRICAPQGLYADYLVPGDNGYFSTPQDFDWECCATMDESWGYKQHARVNRTGDELIVQLATVVSAGGNLLLNIGPKPDGTIPEGQKSILKEIAVWMKDNREAIHGTRPNPFGEFFPWGVCTVKGTDIYLLVTEWRNGKNISLSRLKNTVTSVELLGDKDRELNFTRIGDNVEITLKGEPLFKSASVIKVSCAGHALNIQPVRIAEAQGEVLLPARYAQSRGQKMSGMRHSIQGEEVAINLKQGHNSEHVIWEFDVDKPGRFEVIADVIGRDSGNLREATLFISTGAEMESAAKIDAQSVQSASQVIGTIEIEKPDSAKVSIRVEGGRGNPLFLKALRLKRL